MVTVGTIETGAARRVASVPEHVVTVTTVAPRLTAVVAQTTTWEQFPGLWRQLLDEVYAVVRNEPSSARWQNVMLYKDDTPAVEVGVLVASALADRGRVIASQLPGGKVATTTHRGDYSGLELAHTAVRRFAERERLELQGPRWEIYGHHDDRREPETDVYYLLR
jgi:effector-binding domain-containing protein